MHYLVFEINFHIHSVSVISLVSIHFLTHLSTHLSHHPSSHHPSLVHSFTPGLKPTFSTNPFHLRLLYLLDCLIITGLDRTYHAHYFIFSFKFYFFLFIPCGRLSWLPVSFLLHVKYTLSYRIVLQTLRVFW